MSSSGIEGPADALFEVPPAEFVRARNELAKRLRKELGPEVARAVAGLRKPSVAAWACNRLARHRRDEVAALLEATEVSRAAAVEGDGATVRASARRRNEIVASLVRAAGEMLREARIEPSRTRLEAIRDALLAAATDPDSSDLLRTGRLTQTPEAAGFDAAFGSVLPEAPAPAPEAAEKEAAAEAARLRARKLEAEAADAERRARALEREADRAELEAARTRAKADDARREADVAHQRLAEGGGGSEA